MIRVFLASLLLVLAHVGTPAWAHASLVASDPANNAVLSAAPAKVVLEFNEPVSTIALRLIHQGGTVDLATVPARDSQIEVDLPSNLANGTYALSWRVISADGHPVGGSLLFSVGAATGEPGGVAGDTPSASHVALWIARLVLYVGLFFGAGGCFFVAWISTPPSPSLRTCLRALLVAGLVAAPLALALQGVDVIDGGLDRIGDPTVWAAGFATSYGPTIVVAMAALTAALISLASAGSRARRLWAGLALAGVGLAPALSGHASAAEPQLLTRPAVFVHMAAVAFWIGAFLPLLARLRRGGAELDAALARFSRWIPVAVVCLLASGITLAVVQLGNIASLWTTAYGLVFEGKMVAVIALLAVAAVNRFRLTSAVRSGLPAAMRSMRRSIRLEIGLAVVIFALVGVWRFTPPPRALAAAAAAAEPFLTVVFDPAWMAHLAVEPARVGAVTVSAEVMRTGDAGTGPKGVTLILRNDQAGIEPIEQVLVQQSPLQWSGHFLVPVPGRWSVEVRVLVSDFAESSLVGTIDIKP